MLWVGVSRELVEVSALKSLMNRKETAFQFSNPTDELSIIVIP